MNTNQNQTTPIAPTEIKIFTDLNCPFCFAQHERICREQLQDTVQWCYVEHAPELNSQAMTKEQAGQFDQEFQLISERATDINLRHPDCCTNSRLAILSLITVELTSTTRAATYRQLLFRAYWQENKDISDPQVIHELLNEVGLAALKISNDAGRIQQKWQDAWELGGFDRRIPAMSASNNTKLLGLQSSDNIRNFVLGKNEESIAGGTCLHHDDFNVVILGEQSLSEQILQQANGIHSAFFSTLDALIVHCKRHAVDAVILDYSFDMQHGYQCIRKLKEELGTSLEYPLIYVSKTGHSGEEVHAFTLGANDFIHLKSDISPFIARLKNNLNQSRTVSLLHQYATVDGLTGLLNKREFMLTFENEWRHASRNNLSMGLIMIDIDHFKNYNDTHGHYAGDEILRQVALCLGKQIFRAKDLIARFGGEEFIILLPDTDVQGTEQVCDHLVKAVQQMNIPHPSSPVENHITISAGGCCSTPNESQFAKHLIERADKALYHAKNNGRNQYTIGNLTLVS